MARVAVGAFAMIALACACQSSGGQLQSAASPGACSNGSSQDLTVSGSAAAHITCAAAVCRLSGTGGSLVNISIPGPSGMQVGLRIGTATAGPDAYHGAAFYPIGSALGDGITVKTATRSYGPEPGGSVRINRDTASTIGGVVNGDAGPVHVTGMFSCTRA